MNNTTREYYRKLEYRKLNSLPHIVQIIYLLLFTFAFSPLIIYILVRKSMKYVKG